MATDDTPDTPAEGAGDAAVAAPEGPVKLP